MFSDFGSVGSEPYTAAELASIIRLTLCSLQACRTLRVPVTLTS